MENDQIPKQEKKEFISVYIARWLKSQLDKWTERGILSQDQKEAIKALYSWPDARAFQEGKESTSSIKLISVLQAIGSFLIGIGVLSLIAFNWPKMLNATKLAIIIASIVSAHMTGAYFLLYKPKHQKAGYSFIFLGNLLFGAGIWLIAQIYHLPADFPTGTFLWALGVIPFAYVARSKLNYFFALALFIVWTINESLGTGQPNISFLFILLALLVPLSYYLRSKAALVICILTGGLWLLINNIFWFRDFVTIHLFIPFALYGILLLAFSNLHLVKGAFKEYQKIYTTIGTIIIGIVTFLIPLFGVANLYPDIVSVGQLTLSFWICSAILLAAGFAINGFINEKLLDNRGIIIKKMFPALIASVLFIFLMPFMGGSLILSLVPVALIAFSHMYHTRSKLFIKLFFIYLLVWLPFCLIQWRQAFLLFLLYMAYGATSYCLGWIFISRYKDDSSGVLFKFLGLLTVFFSLYIFSFSGAAMHFSLNYVLPSSFDFWVLLGLFYAVEIFAHKHILEFSYPKEKKGLIPEEQAVISILFVVPIVVFFAVSQNLPHLWYTFLINFFSIGFMVLCLIIGYRRRETHMKVLSFIMLILFVATRYCEIEWSLFYKAILFILTGIIIMTGGVFLEKNKDKVAIIE